MDEAAKKLADRFSPHVPTALLAHLYREKELFPLNRAQLDDSGIKEVLDASKSWTAEVICNGQYIQFNCPDCHSLMFQPCTKRGVTHAMRVATMHKPRCCAERLEKFTETGIPAVWPDSLDE